MSVHVTATLIDHNVTRTWRDGNLTFIVFESPDYADLLKKLRGLKVEIDTAIALCDLDLRNICESRG